jgi:hypothetical protein
MLPSGVLKMAADFSVARLAATDSRVCHTHTFNFVLSLHFTSVYSTVIEIFTRVPRLANMRLQKISSFSVSIT